MKFSCLVVLTALLQESCFADVDEHDGKCDARFVECEAVCEFACSSDHDIVEIESLDAHHKVLRELPWSHLSGHRQVDREQYKGEILNALAGAVSSKSGSKQKSPKSALGERLGEYGAIAKRDPGLIAWPCLDHCRYECMHRTVAESGKVVKFFGKWPFQRVGVFQELLSSVYSFLNAVPYILFAMTQTFKTLTPPVFRIYTLIVAFMWIASGVFHCRDTPLTQHVDYFSAIGGVFANCTVAVVLLLKSARKRALVVTGMALLWLTHVSYMGLVSFDFDWNMKVGVVAALSGTISWQIWFLRNRRSKPHAWLIPPVTLGLFPLFLTFELGDFPPGPMGLADAHAFWHLSTIPISCAWAVFMFKESRAGRRIKAI